jgi:hypothetical protein
MDKRIFDVGGILLILSGTIGLFLWLVSIAGGFTSSIIPSASSLASAAGIEMLHEFLLVVVGLTVSLGTIVGGLLVMKIPALISASRNEDVENKVNRLQTVVWKLVQHLKKQG